MKKCKKCQVELILEVDKKKSNVTKSQYDRYTSYCKKCFNSKNDKQRTELKNKLLQEPLKEIDLKSFTSDLYNYKFNNTVNEEYLKSRNYKLPCIIQSPMGTGKTQAVIDIINQNKKKNIVYVTVNITTLNSLHERLNKESIKYTSHLNKPVFNSAALIKQNKVITITPDSFYKLSYEPDIIIVDEIFSVLVEMISKIENLKDFNRKLDYINSYKRIIEHKNYLLLDAFIPNEIIEVFKFKPAEKIHNETTAQ